MYAGRPSVCRNCGALVGAGEAECAVCGFPAGAQPASPPPQQQTSQPHERSVTDPETMRFARAVLTRPSTFTFVFLAVNVFVFLLMSWAAPDGSRDSGVLVVYGAKVNTLIDAGQWWRFVTPIFLHTGAIHLLVNMYSLFILGPYVEKLYGSARFVFFWIATGIGGVFASYLASRPGMQGGALGSFFFRGDNNVPSAGASGALFGLIGVLFVFGIKFRHELPEGFKRAFGTGMIPTILINLFIGYSIPNIDNAAHMGGFVAGALLALFVGYKRPGQSASVAVLWHVLQVASLLLVVVSFGQVVRYMGSAQPLPENAAQVRARTIDAYVEALNEGQKAFHAVVNRGDAEAATRAIVQLERVPPLDAKPDGLRLELRELLVRGRALALLSAEERNDAPGRGQLKQLVSDFASWDQRFDEWVKTEGGNYGIVLEPQNDNAPPNENAPPANETRPSQDKNAPPQNENASPATRR
jgi:membrane associated rhomboid family serine protease